jgi:hypothetical protein
MKKKLIGRENNNINNIFNDNNIMWVVGEFFN